MIPDTKQQPAVATEKEFDLDFADSPVPRAIEPEPEKGAEIGAHELKKAGNEISYVRGGVSRPAAASNAPVLVVEDDETTRLLLAKILDERGFPVRTAANAQELAQAIRQPPLPRLILLDVGLPRVSGFQILDQLRQHPQTTKVPIVMLTGRSENKDILRGIALGADGYLSKPIKPETLLSVIDRVLEPAAKGPGG